jgi:hypothetical protein
MKDTWIQDIKNHKLKKYSQTGEEGYIEFILSKLPKGPGFLVDLGARDGYSLSNTRMLIEKGYRHISLDYDTREAKDVHKEFITRDNVTRLLEVYGCPALFDLLNIDLDGNDYDILEAVLRAYTPMLVVAEFNGTIPEGESKKIIYNPDHNWNPKEQNYYGFSFSAGLKLAEKYGYKVIFQNDHLNMYMVRKDLLEDPNADIPLGFKRQSYWGINKQKEHLWEQV